VLGLEEAPLHSHNTARGSFIEVGGVTQHAPTPRFSRTPSTTPKPMSTPGTHTTETLLQYGFDQAQIDLLLQQGAVAQL
jgi:alpha-methylacyl-CoA racemase